MYVGRTGGAAKVTVTEGGGILADARAEVEGSVDDEEEVAAVEVAVEVEVEWCSVAVVVVSGTASGGIGASGRRCGEHIVIGEC